MTPSASPDQTPRDEHGKPYIESNEDGDTFWINGHDVSEVEAREALRSELASTWGGDLSGRAATIAAREATFERSWYRYDLNMVEYDDGEMLRCAATDDGAEAFTMLVLSDD